MGERGKSKVPAKQATPTFGGLYWLRIGCGALAGLVAYAFFSQIPVSIDNASNGILVAVLFYLVTYYVARYALYKKLEQESLSKLYTTGIGGYIMLFLFTWILLFTLFSA